MKLKEGYDDRLFEFLPVLNRSKHSRPDWTSPHPTYTV